MPSSRINIHGFIPSSGLGRRQRVLSDPLRNDDGRPKGFLPVGNYVLADFSINALRTLAGAQSQQAQLKSISVSVGPRPFSVPFERHLTNRGAYPFDIKVHAEENVAGTGGIVSILTKELTLGSRDLVCVLPCDTPHAIDLRPIVKAHLKSEAAVTVVALPISWVDPQWSRHSFATLQVEELPNLQKERALLGDGFDKQKFAQDAVRRAAELQSKSPRVTYVHDKQKLDQPPSNLVNTSIMIFNAELIERLSGALRHREVNPNFCSLGRHVLPLLGGRSEEFSQVHTTERDWEAQKAIFELVEDIKNGQYPMHAYILPPGTYWRDVGDPLALIEANMDFLDGRIGTEVDPTGQFWFKTSWGWQGRYGADIDRSLELPKLADPSEGKPAPNGSLIGSRTLIRASAHIDHSVILDYADVAGAVNNSVVFPGDPNHEEGGNTSIRRGTVPEQVHLNNCLYVSGNLPQTGYFNDSIIYRTIDGGVGIDPLGGPSHK